MATLRRTMALKGMLLIRSRIGVQQIMLRGFSKVVDKCSEEYFKQVSTHSDIYVPDSWTTFAITPAIFNSDLYVASTLVSSTNFTKWPYMLIMILTCHVSLFSPTRLGRKGIAILDCIFINLHVQAVERPLVVFMKGVPASPMVSAGDLYCMFSTYTRLNSTRAVQHPSLGPIVISILTIRRPSSCDLACLSDGMTW